MLSERPKTRVRVTRASSARAHPRGWLTDLLLVSFRVFQLFEIVGVIEFENENPALAVGFAIDLGADFRATRRDIRHPYAPVQARRKRSACDFADAFCVLEDCVMRSRWWSFLFHSKRHKLFVRSFFFCFNQNVPSDEIWFCQIYKEPQSCFDRISFRRQIGTVERVTHFQAQCVARTETAGLNSEWLAFFERGVPKLDRIRCAKENFNAVLTRVTSPGDGDSRPFERKIGDRISRWKIGIRAK